MRSPRLAALVDGIPVTAVIAFTLTDPGSYKTKEFDLVISTKGSSSNSIWLNSPIGQVLVSVYIEDSQSTNEYFKFDGLADQISLDPLRHRARIRGHDHSAILVRASPQDVFCNQTASEVVRQIALRHDMLCDATDTTAIIGSYRNNEHNQLLLAAHSHFGSEWQLLVYLARQEAFELFVEDATIFFSPTEVLNRSTWPITLADISEFKYHRECYVSAGTHLIVKSWNTDLNQMVSYEIDTLPGSPATFSGSVLDRVIIRPNLDFEDAEIIARRYSTNINDRQTNVVFTMPGETSMRPRDAIILSGTGTGLDTQYIIRSMRRRFSPSSGFSQYIRATPLQDVLPNSLDNEQI